MSQKTLFCSWKKLFEFFINFKYYLTMRCFHPVVFYLKHIFFFRIINSSADSSPLLDIVLGKYLLAY